MIQKITQNIGNFWTVNLIMRAKIVNQSSDIPVRRTGSYRHKKSTACRSPAILNYKQTAVTFSVYTVWQYNPS